MPGEPPEEGCWDWPASTNKGYGQFSMNGGTRIIGAHQASYRKFVGDIPPGRLNLILHSCDRPICVQPKHLSLGDHAKNIHEAIERGRFPRGSTNGRSKLTESDVLWIRTSGLSPKYMAAVLHVSEPAVYVARQGKSWKHVAMKAEAS